MSEELKPCPFCGSENVIVDKSRRKTSLVTSETDARVHCTECFCDGPKASTDLYSYVEIERAASVLWNERSFLGEVGVEYEIHYTYGGCNSLGGTTEHGVVYAPGETYPRGKARRFTLAEAIEWVKNEFPSSRGASPSIVVVLPT